MHVHIEQDSHGCFALDDELMDASAAYFKASEHRTRTLEHIAAYYRQQEHGGRGLHGGCGHLDRASGPVREELADQAAVHADVLIPFGSVDPLGGAAAVQRARRLVTEHGVRGFKFHPSLQAFEPNDPEFYPLYKTLAELGVVALFHTGQTGDRGRAPWWSGDQAAVLRTDADRRRRSRLPRPDHRDGAPVSAIAARPSRSPPTNPTSTSTCPGGHPSTSHPNSSAPPTACSNARCSSGPTIRS